MTKRCYKCDGEKDTSLFCRDKRMKNGIGSWCKQCFNSYRDENRIKDPTYKGRKREYDKKRRANPCIRAKENERSKQYKRNNKDVRNAKERERYYNRRVLINGIKVESGCIDCGYNTHAAALDFDHKENKMFNIGNSIGYNMKRVMKEIEKCEIRCANCHRVATYNRLFGEI